MKMLSKIPALNYPPSRSCLFFVVCLMIMIAANAIVLPQEMRRIDNFKKVVEHQNIGYKFAGLEKFTADIDYMGYYSDLGLDNEEHAKYFSTAQYILAPTVLEYNNLNRDYILFVCTNEVVAWKKMKDLNAQPLRRNQYGMVLAKRRR